LQENIFFFLESADCDYLAPGALIQVAFSRTIPCNSQMAKGEIVPYRIIGVEPPQASRDIQCHGPTRAPHRCQPDIGRNPGDMGIQRDNQLSGSHLGPDSAIDPVVGAHHPSQVEVQAFAGAALGRRREEKTDAYTPLQFTARIKLFMAETHHDSAEPFESRCDFGLAWRQSGDERALQ